MNKKEKTSKLLLQYILSYLCILLLPLAVLSGFVYSYVLNVLADEVKVNNLHTLEKARDIVEAQMEYMMSLENTVYLENTLDQFVLEGDTVKAMTIQKELKKYLRMNSFCYDMAYYQEKDPYILTAKSSCRKESFWKQMYQFEDWSYEAFQQELREHQTLYFKGVQLVKPAEGVERKLVVLVQPLKTKTDIRCVMYLIDAQLFTEVLPYGDDSGEKVSMILDAQGQVLALEGEEALAYQVLQENGQEEKIEAQDQMKLEGREYLRSYVYSEDTGWKYISLVRADSIGNKVQHVKTLMLVMCMIVLVTGTGGGLWLARRQFAPIRELDRITENLPVKDEKGSEIDHVAYALEYLNSENKRLQAEDELKNSAVKELFLTKLLTGKYHSEEEAGEEKEKAGVQFGGESYVAFIIQMDNNLGQKEQLLEDSFISAAPIGVEVMVRIQPETGKILGAAGYVEALEGRMETYLQDILELLANDMELHGIAAVGQKKGSMVALAESYKEATQAMEYRVVLVRQKLIRYEEILLRGNDSFKLRPGDLAGFVKGKNIEGMDNFLKAALEEICWRKADIRQIRRQCDEFVFTVEKLVEEMNRDVFLENPIYDNVSEVLRYKNCVELMEIIRLVCCNIIERLNEASGNSLTEELTAYVKENCFACEFSTTAMAEHFQMSLPYLSQYFKSHVGKTLLDYVTDLKIEKAQELLRGTNLSVKEIAEQVGYYNVNSFSRRFKQITGMAPGEYRKLV